MSYVGRKLGINFKGRKKNRDELDDDYNRNHHSIGSVTLGVPLANAGKSSSLNSLHSEGDAVNGGGLDHDDVVTLAYDVRRFSEALARLKGVVSNSEMVEADNQRLEAHKHLGEVLAILTSVLQNHSSLSSGDIIKAAATLITKIKSCNYEDVTSHVSELPRGVDQLEHAFACSVSEYLMGDIYNHSPLQKAKSHDNLLGSDVDGQEQQTPGRNTASQLSDEDLDELLSRQEGGVELALDRAKAWSKHARDVITYIDKRAQLDLDYSKRLTDLAQRMRASSSQDHFVPLQLTFLTAVEQDVDMANTTHTTASLTMGSRFIEPLSARKQEHDKSRKYLKNTWEKQKRRMSDAVANLKKSRTLYVTRQQDHEKAKEATQKAEGDITSASHQVKSQEKADKKKRMEEEALQRALEAESTYKNCIADANNKQQEMETTKRDILADIRKLIFKSDTVLKSVTVSYYQLLQQTTSPIHVQYRTLVETTDQYEPGSQYREFVRKQAWEAEPVTPDSFTFEPYCPDTKAYETQRKMSTQSSESASSDLVQPYDESPLSAAGRRHGISIPLNPVFLLILKDDCRAAALAWAQDHDNEIATDSDRMSGDSSKSRESSPTHSPYQQQVSPRFGRNVDLDQSFDSTSAKYGRQFCLSRAAQTHEFRKLKKAATTCCVCDSPVFHQSVQCEKCLLTAHVKCLKHLQVVCGGGEGQGQGVAQAVFGVNFFGPGWSAHVPQVVRVCCAQIESNGIECKGIYRLSGVKHKVEQVCQRFLPDGSRVDLSDVSPNVVANVLKLYLRELPDPLLTHRRYEELIRVAKEEEASGLTLDQVLQKLQLLLLKLPKGARLTCRHLMYHLKRVADNESVNQMSASNLGIVFGPTLLRPAEGAASMNALVNTPLQTRVVELLILHAKELFDTEYEMSEKTELSPATQTLPEVQIQAASCDNLEHATEVTNRAVPETENLMKELEQAAPAIMKSSLNSSGDLKDEVDGPVISVSMESDDTSTSLPDDSNDAKNSVLFNSYPQAHARVTPSLSSPARCANLGVPLLTRTNSRSLDNLIDCERRAMADVTKAGSLGLRRRLLPTELRPVSTTPTGPRPSLTKPRTYSPQVERRGAQPRRQSLLTKSGSIDLVELDSVRESHDETTDDVMRHHGESWHLPRRQSTSSSMGGNSPLHAMSWGFRSSQTSPESSNTTPTRYQDLDGVDPHERLAHLGKESANSTLRRNSDMCVNVMLQRPGQDPPSAERKPRFV